MADRPAVGASRIQFPLSRPGRTIDLFYWLLGESGGNMLSLNYEIKEFIKSLGNKDPFDAIWFAHQEATKIDRMLMRHPLAIGGQKKQMETYASDLRNLIASMRYVAVPRKAKDAGWAESLKKWL
jgi:hypothetical protein